MKDGGFRMEVESRRVMDVLVRNFLVKFSPLQKVVDISFVVSPKFMPWMGGRLEWGEGGGSGFHFLYFL